MKEILEAILAGDTPTEAYAALKVPEAYTAVTVHKDEEQMKCSTAFMVCKGG